MSYGDPRWYYADTERRLAQLEHAEPDFRHVDPPNPAGKLILPGRNVQWLVNSNYVVAIEADKIEFMEGNSWNMGHARALFDLIEQGQNPVFELPAARVYRITPDVVAATQRYYDEDELEYQYGMEKPWKNHDVGTLRAQLLDGNHRALAAIAAGETHIPVIVGENYRGDVLPSEWLTVETPKKRKRAPAKKRRR